MKTSVKIRLATYALGVSLLGGAYSLKSVVTHGVAVSKLDNELTREFGDVINLEQLICDQECILSERVDARSIVDGTVQLERYAAAKNKIDSYRADIAVLMTPARKENRAKLKVSHDNELDACSTAVFALLGCYCAGFISVNVREWLEKKRYTENRG